MGLTRNTNRSSFDNVKHAPQNCLCPRVVTWWTCFLLVIFSSIVHAETVTIPVRQIGLGLLNCSALSPDGTKILTGGWDRSVRLWDVRTAQLLQTFWGHKGEVHAVAFSADGSKVLSGSDDFTAKLWDTASGQLIRSFSSSNMVGVDSVAFSADDKRILTSSWDGKARLWNAETGEQIRQFINGISPDPAAMSPDGSRILTTDMNDNALLWDTETGNLIKKFSGHTWAITSVAFSPDGKKILTGSWDDTAMIWDTESGQSLLTLIDSASPMWAVRSVAFSPDGKTVLTSSDDIRTSTRLWDAETGACLTGLWGLGGIPMNQACSKDGLRLLLTEGSTTVRVRDLTNFNVRCTLPQHSTSSVNSLAYSPDGKKILTGGDWSSAARLWNAETGEELRIFSGHSDWITSVAYSPDGKKVLTGSKDKTARLWDAGTGQFLRTLSGHTDIITSVAYSPDGTKVLTGSRDNTTRLWNAETGECLQTVSGPANSVNFSPDGMIMLTGGGQHVKLWTTGTGQPLRTLSFTTGTVTSVSFSPDGTKVLAGTGWGKEAYLWDAESEQVLCVFKGHTSAILSVAFSPDGTKVLTGSDDRSMVIVTPGEPPDVINGNDCTARLWDAGTGQLLRVFPDTGAVNSVAFSPDGTMALTGSEAGTIRLWWTTKNDARIWAVYE